MDLVSSQGVLVQGERTHKPGLELKPGYEVTLESLPSTSLHNLTPVEMELDVRYEDDVLLVVNKPRSLTVHPAASEPHATLVHGLLARSHSLSLVGGEFRPGIVHRLDKETTGLLVVAKSDEAHRSLATQIQNKTMERRYLAVVHGMFDETRLTLTGDIGRHPARPTMMAVVPRGKPAKTHVQVLKFNEQGTLVACKLDTGRTHQIRVHLATFGRPVKGDHLYANGAWATPPMQLHAAAIGFDHPKTNKRVRVYAPPPDDFEPQLRATEEEVWDWI